MAAEAPYRVELAKSARSACVASKEKIDKGELRFGTLVMMGGKGSYKWRKMNFITGKQAANVIEAVGGAEKLDGFAELGADKQSEVIKAFEVAKGTFDAVSASGKGRTAASKRSAKGVPEASEVLDTSSPPSKKAKTSGPRSKAAPPTSSPSTSSTSSTSLGAKTPSPSKSLSEAAIQAAHKLIDLARDGLWDDLYKQMDSQRENLVNIRPEVRQYSVLQQAAFLGHLEAVTKLLKDYKADPKLLSKDGQTAEEIAREEGYEEVGELLEKASHGSDIEELTPEKVARMEKDKTDTKPRPVPTLADDSPKWQIAHKLIDLARDASWSKLYSELDKHPELVNVRPSVREYGVLQQAVYHGEQKAVDKLIDEYGADLQLESKYGEKVLSIATGQSHEDLVKSLKVRLGEAVPEASSASGGDDDFDMVQMPDGSWKICPKSKTDSLDSSSTKASETEDVAMSTSEGESSAKTSVKAIPTLTAEVVQAAHGIIDLARDGRWSDLFSALDKNGELVNVRPAVRQYSVLQQAAWHGDEGAVFTLIEKYGADPSLCTKSGESLKEVAEEQGHDSIAEKLSKYI
eukprot:TRINITY_DN112025_c0_g1_i1.p1 TRINITY_DN112025_c0_g1~~TRINITY_DN112025_c0_g1_i1.p1  ORF type:complete len:575 (-),score=150.92 TRINITY_DN112025_c0_g1_i1:135-1859(-)